MAIHWQTEQFHLLLVLSLFFSNLAILSVESRLSELSDKYLRVGLVGLSCFRGYLCIFLFDNLFSGFCLSYVLFIVDVGPEWS